MPELRLTGLAIYDCPNSELTQSSQKTDRVDCRGLHNDVCSVVLTVTLV